MGAEAAWGRAWRGSPWRPAGLRAGIRAGAALCRVAGSLRLNCRPLLLCSSPSWNGLQAAQGEDVLTGTGGSVRRRAGVRASRVGAVSAH